jgi:xanthine dehydrogenase large subunit
MSVAQSLPHDAARLHVTGEARYVDDIPVPRDTLHLAFGLSTVAHGEIVSMDLDAVRAAPGVVLVLTAADLPHENDVSPSPWPEPLLADGIVHHVGQPVFVVAATSHLAARRAVRLAKIDYRERPALLTIDDALAADSRYEEGPRIYGRGDAAAAIAAAPLKVEGRIEIGGQEHFYLEGQAALALPQEGGDMVVHSSSQHPTEIQHKVAEALGRPMNAVRVEVRRMGGGFGGKESQGNALACACAVVAARPGGPPRCATTATTTWSSPASATSSGSTTGRGWTARGGFWAWSSCSTCAAAGASTCRFPWRTGRCCMPTTPISSRRSGSRATGCAPTPSRTPPSGASAGRRGWWGSSG